MSGLFSRLPEDTRPSDRAIVGALRVIVVFIVFFCAWLVAMLVVQGVRLSETETALKRHGCAEAPP